MRPLRRDDSGMELPINIVVMVVVGLAALSALLLMLPKPTLPMTIAVTEVDAEVDGTPRTYESGSALILKPAPGTQETWVKAKIRLADSEGRPVRDASCLLRGPGGLVVTSRPLETPGEYEFDGSSGPATKMRLAGVTEAKLSITCDAPGYFEAQDLQAITAVVA